MKKIKYPNIHLNKDEELISEEEILEEMDHNKYENEQQNQSFKESFNDLQE